MVLMHAKGYQLTNGKTCNFIVGQKDCLSAEGYVDNPTTGTITGWNASVRRTWCNSLYLNSFPMTFRMIFKQFKSIAGNNAGVAVTSDDYFALPAEKEVFGTNQYGNATAEASLFQFEYYAISTKRIKKVGGSNRPWHERTYASTYGGGYCRVLADGRADTNGASYYLGISPFGCI